MLESAGAWLDDPALPSFQEAMRWKANESPVELATLAGVDFLPRLYAYAINESGMAVGEIVGNTGLRAARAGRQRAPSWTWGTGKTSCALPTAANGRPISRPARVTRNFERQQRPPTHPVPARRTAPADALAAIVRTQAFG